MNEFYNRESEKDKRRQHRKSMPDAEIILWSKLKGRQLEKIGNDVQTRTRGNRELVIGSAGTTPPGPPLARVGKGRRSIRLL